MSKTAVTYKQTKSKRLKIIDSQWKGSNAGYQWGTALLVILSLYELKCVTLSVNFS